MAGSVALWGAGAGVRLGGLPAVGLLPPLLRYALAPGVKAPLRPWQRAAGVAQMVVLVGALSPWRPPRGLAVAAVLAQTVALLASRRPAD